MLKTPYSQVQDFEFADVDNDGNLELIIMSSLKTKFTSKDMYYGGFELSYLQHSNREFGPSNTITKHVHQKGHYSWLKWISACDVLSDGKIDIVYEKLGEGNFFVEMNKEPFFNWTRADRIVWKNLGSGDFSILRFEDPNYFTDNTTYYKNTIKFFLVRSEKVFFEGRFIFPSERQENLLNNLQNHPKAKPIRDFLIEEFDGVFIK